MNKIITYTAFVFSMILFIGCESNNSDNNNEITAQSNNISNNSRDLIRTNLDRKNIFWIK